MLCRTQREARLLITLLGHALVLTATSRTPSAAPPHSADEAHAALPAIAWRLQGPLEHAEETVLADGTRRLHFACNRCLDLPRELPLIQQSNFGETLLVPTNCPK